MKLSLTQRHQTFYAALQASFIMLWYNAYTNIFKFTFLLFVYTTSYIIRTSIYYTYIIYEYLCVNVYLESNDHHQKT